MAEQKGRKLSSILKDLDDISKTLTGQRIPYWTKRGWEEIQRTRANTAVVEQVDNPYDILGLDPNCIPSDIIYQYRQLAKKYHPDNLETGDEATFKKVTAAYEELCRQRGIR